MSRRPSHTAVLLHPHATISDLEPPASDPTLRTPYTDFQVSRDLRHIVWPLDIFAGRPKRFLRRFLLDGLPIPEDFTSSSGMDRHVATLFEDGTCAIHRADALPGKRFTSDTMLRIHPVDATDAPASPAPDPFGRANLERAVGALVQPALPDRPGERVVPEMWALFRDRDGNETVAHVRRGDLVERTLEAALEKARTTASRLRRLPRNSVQGDDLEAAIGVAIGSADGILADIGALLHAQDGPKHRLALLDGLSVHVGDRHWIRPFAAIDAMQFSSDGKHLAVVGEQAGWRVAIDDRPGPGFDRIVGFRWSGPSACGYIGFRDGRIWRVAVEI